MSWSTANHEVIPDQEFSLPGSTMHPYLWAFLVSDGENFRESADNYAVLRGNIVSAISKFEGRSVQGRQPTENIGGSRIRTWKALFERSGLLTVSNQGLIEVSPFGRSVRNLFDDLSSRINGANQHLTQWSISVLSRYPLLNPLEGGQGGDGPYPEDSDLLPFRAIWRAARQLDNRLHWQEMNRVIMLLNYESEVPSAIERIAKARRQGGEAYYQTPERWLGDDCAVVDGEQTRRRVTPWLSRAAFGGLIADSNDDTGLWTIHESIAPLIDNELQNAIIIPPQCRTDRSSFVRWLSEPLIRPLISVSHEDSGFIEVIKNRVSRYASTKFICFSGVPGTGKTRLARIIADDLTDGDPYRSAEIQFHESIAYEDFVEGFVPKSDGSGFQLVKKTLRLICSRAASDPLSRLFVLIIEEFTRANTHAVLGELLTYIEHRNRRFTYALSQEEDSIPSNLVVLITMNPRDRSSQQLDNAIRRRLHYIDVSPSVSALTSMLGDKISAELMQRLQEWYTEWHSILPFGHGIFSQVLDDDGLVEVWHGTCLRLLENSIGDIDERYQSLVASFPCHQS